MCEFTYIENDEIDHKTFSNAIQNIEKLITPSLSDEGIDIEEYINKLEENAIRVAIISQENDVLGIAAIYTNDVKNRKAFISFIGLTEKNIGKRIGEHLLKRCEKIAAEKGMLSIYLEVYKENSRALRFYKKNGYRIENRKEKSYIMYKKLMR